MSVYKICKTKKDVLELIKYCKQTKTASIDYETTSLNYHSKDEYPLCLGVSFQPGSSWIIPLGHKESPFRNKWKRIFRLFSREVLEDWDIVKYAWNLKFEYKWGMQYNSFMKGRIFDVMLMKYCLDEERPHGLKDHVTMFYPKYANYEKAIKITNLANEPLEKVAQYCGIDCDLTLRSGIYMEKRLIKLGFYNLFRNLLMMMTRVLAESEYRGIIIDRPFLMTLVKKYQGKIDECELKLRKTPSLLKYEIKHKKYVIDNLVKEVELEIDKIREQGEKNAATLIRNREIKIKNILEGKYNKKEEKKIGPINFASPDQLAEFLFTSKFGLRLKIIEKTETGKPSTSEAVLEQLQKKDNSGFMKVLMELRGLAKLNSTYILGMVDILDSNNRAHANFKLLTVTGRLSCEDPNLQNIPRTTTNPDIKKMFIPPPGYLLLELDYGQAELRVVAELANDKAMIDIFKRGYNIHVATACKMNGGIEQYEEVKKIIKIAEAMSSDEIQKPENANYLKWKKAKKKAKTINFGILYEQGDDKLAEGLECSKEEAAIFKSEWFKAYPQVKKWIEAQHKLVKKQGYVTTPFGRKRRLYNIYSEKYGVMLEAQRQSVNAPIQSIASDFTSLSQIVIREMIMRGELPNDLLEAYTVHDSIGFYIRPEHVNWVVPKLVQVCQNPNTLPFFGFEFKRVKMKASTEIGINWAELNDCDPEKEPNKDYSQLLKAA